MADRKQAMELAKKLGIKKGISIAIMNPPYGFVQSLVEIREDIRAMNTDVKMGEAVDVDLYVYFCRGRKGLEETAPRLVEDLARNGTLWIGWLRPKGIDNNLNEQTVKEIAQKHGLKDVGAMTLSDEWPMLKFVRAEEKK